MKSFAGAVCAALLALSHCAGHAHALEAGAAKIEIVPVAGAPLDGDYARLGRPAIGTRDPLFVRALFLQDGELAICILSADLFAITQDLRAKILEKAPAVVPRDQIVLVATHTPNGPGGLDHSWLGRQRGGRFMGDGVEAVASAFAEAIQAAYDRRTRASAGYAAIETSLVVNQFDPAAPTDGLLGVLRVDDSDGNPIALVANLGAAAMGGSGMEFSADFPGAFCNSLEGMAATPTTAIFLNGASADQAPANVTEVQAFAEALAGRAKSLVNEIKCREVTIGFNAATQRVPLHSARPFYPDEALFQVVEIDRLGMLFMSPIPRASVSANIRKVALARGYAQCMVVAPANGYFGAVAPLETIARAQKAEPVFFGPDAAAWLEASAAAVIPHGEAPVIEDVTAPKLAAEERGGVTYATLSGTPRDFGYLRGALMTSAQVQPSLPARWMSSVTGGVLGHWDLMRSAVDVEPIASPIAGEAARGLLQTVSAASVETLAGMSAGAGMPLTKVWLRQLAPSGDGAPIGPVGVAFGFETADGGAVLAQSLEWPEAAQPIFARVTPKSGPAYLIVGFPWQMSGCAGVNDAGVAISVMPFAATDSVSIPAEVILGEVLAQATTFEEAIALLSVPRPGVSGRVLLACDSHDRSQTALIDLGATPAVSQLPNPSDTTGITSARDLRVQKLLSGAESLSVTDAERILVDHDRRSGDADGILRAETRACVVLVPRRREVRVMAPDVGAPRGFETITLRSGES